MKRARETQTKASTEYLESVLDENFKPNFRHKHPCACPKIARLSDSDLIQDAKLRMAREAEKDNIPIRNMETQDPNQSRPQSLTGKYLQTGVIQMKEKVTMLELSLLTYKNYNPVPPQQMNH